MKKAAKKIRNSGKNSGKLNIYLIGEKIFSNSKDAFTLYDQSNFGESVKGKIFYSAAESFFLFVIGRANVYLGKKKLNHDSFMAEIVKKEPNFFTRYSVYSDLRSKGYIVKSALKFGAEFRVYDRGVKPGEDHAKWVVFPVHEAYALTWQEFAAKNRVAHSTKKKLLIGVVDDEGDVSYWECRWVKP